MFFVTYLQRELTRRAGQAIVVALGLAVGVGLVATVSAAAAGVARAESGVLGALYGVGTDVTVTGAACGCGQSPNESPAQSAQLTDVSPGGTSSALGSLYSGISASKVAEAARLPGVAAAAGGITLLESSITFSKNGPSTGQTSGYTIDGVDTADASLGPLGSASLVSGHVFTAAESDSDVAVLDSVYAKSHGLRAGSAVTVDHARYTVIGIVSQPQGISPPAIYVPLARVQAMPLGGESLKNEVNTIYLAADSASDIPAVRKEVTRLLPGTFVTTASSLPSQVTGSLASAVKLVHDLDGWLTVLVLAAAFAMASLLMLAAVSRRAREFGILKAIGWRSRRVVGQVLGESAAIGVVGAAAGVGLGFAGAAVIAAVKPKVSATVGADNYPQLPNAHTNLIGGSSLIHVVPVPLDPSVGAGVIVLAVVLALAGGLLAGVFASWRIAVLRPARALARVA
jgi:putative ABC transport system permease protein